MSERIDEDRFTASIRDAMQIELGKIAEEEIIAAQKRMEQRIRALVGQVVLSTLQYFDVARDRDRVVITVRNEGGTAK